jgi:toxin ParE1/3/4
MAEFSLRPKALADLEKIWDYTVETWGEEQAERYLRLINQSFRKVADNPGLGRPCDTIREGYRNT